MGVVLSLLRAFRPLVSDFLSTIVFLAVMAFTDNVVLATLVGIAIGLCQFGWYWLRGNKIDIMQWASLGLVIVMGSATLYTHDARFMMIKPSIAGAAIATVMLKPGWQMRYLPPVVQQRIAQRQLILWGYAWAALYYALAGANLIIALKYGRHAWEAYSAFVPTLAMIALFAVEYVVLRTAVHRIRAQPVQPAPAE